MHDENRVESNGVSKINFDWPVCSNCPCDADAQCLWCPGKFCRRCVVHHARVHSDDQVI